jgi:hypothetical protein
MFNKTKTVIPEFVEARSRYGMAFHIVPTLGDAAQAPEMHPALCGYANWTPTNTVMPVTREDVEERLPKEHDNAFTCKKCVTAIGAA